MTTTQGSAKEAIGIAGIGVAACAGCCAGPILGFLTAIGLGTVLGIALFGAAGIAIVLLAILPIMRRARQEAACATPTGEPIGPTLERKGQ